MQSDESASSLTTMLASLGPPESVPAGARGGARGAPRARAETHKDETTDANTTIRKEGNMARRRKKTEKVDANRDPITDAPGAHPVGVGVGATGGAAGGAAVGSLAGPGGPRWARSPAEWRAASRARASRSR